MSDCECIAGCPFFNNRMADMPSVAEIYKTRYCKEDWNSCARYRVFSQLGRDSVPANLFPNEFARADALLNG